ncbi:MAG: PilX N-terminal domain-containing pilus assembly protein [Methylobacter sp.]|uniref:pilus assembly PilX family protein n=1 Tax=Methylobacter sp. TaxID=2051955 RepID=UPI002730F36F|nr:PilX N-terminal domain-containing pilus assembly protein [Methylobacter sp.]MDP1664343.1 PilX N-terminal domain-containing pilus assembly protein [Methylobacter sp.]MDP1970837.1 PilX N-terminal domain-containing pilus assembly protein [Methylobacter sp.]
MPNKYSSLKKRQSGVVLPISMIMLLLLTLISVTGSQVAGLEEKMAGNSRDSNLAFQAAEAALRGGETFLTQATLPAFTATGTNGLYSEAGTPPQQSDDWSSFNTVTYSDASLGHTASAPLYVIQQLKAIGSGSLDAGNYNENELYRITARGVGGTSDAVVVLQSVFKR